ncbi:MAG: UDP-N-acetylmuramate--L-alanine ligase, partial [Firmicutes bacterium]|nr:UDP-N-acetylmuramate--L-alanine ligase [Bacillota bacterium]
PRVIERSVLLGDLMDEYEHSIGIAGTHGKTSTSTMLSYIFMETEKDPTITIGGILENLQSNYRIGHSPYFIAEACEYCDSFLHFHPQVGIILNVEAEHLDYFGTYERMVESFRKYADGIKDGGCLVLNHEALGLFPHYDKNLITVSLNDTAADVVAAEVRSTPDHLGNSFDCIYKGQNLGRLTLHVPGTHLVFDALCAVAAALWLGVDFEQIRSGLEKYRGPKKRFEYKGSVNGFSIIDDYAHHPTEMKATLTAARDVVQRELYVVFQPHTFSRTKAFFDDFVSALSLADHIILADIYSASRETDPGDIHSRDITNALLAQGKDAYYFGSFEEIQKFLLKKCCPQDLLITMGAGDVVIIGENLLSM